VGVESENAQLKRRFQEVVTNYTNGLKAPQAADLIHASARGNDTRARLDLSAMLLNDAASSPRKSPNGGASVTARAVADSRQVDLVSHTRTNHVGAQVGDLFIRPRGMDSSCRTAWRLFAIDHPPRVNLG
jgi:hypothetical protein